MLDADIERLNSPLCSPGMRPRLLFVTYTFPPARTAGSVRTGSIAKYLARAGWAVDVLTPDPSVWRYVEHPDAVEIGLSRDGIRRVRTDYPWRWLDSGVVKCANETLAWLAGGIGRRVLSRVGIDRTVGWVSAAERACSHLAAGDVDVILASGPTFSVFPLAKRLAGRLRCPYVLDYRDLWSRNLHRPMPDAARKEAEVLAGSAAVTTVSCSWGSILDREFGVGGKLHVVSNGYDPEQLSTVQPHRFDHFAIVYTGVLYPPKRVITPVMGALRRLADSGRCEDRQWRLHYYGGHGSHVRDEAQRFGLDEQVISHGEVSRMEALSAVKGANLAVVITSVADTPSPADNGMVTGKIFEAIGLGIPTLLIAPAGSDANDVATITGLARRFTADDMEGIAHFIRDLMKGERLQPKDPSAYAWERLVKRLDDVLRQVV